jgi:phenylpropionate dioxygenase-like ring-hydroxylating dioxygenase large terminal subunit
MDHATELELLDRLWQLKIDRSTSMDSSCWHESADSYVDPEHLAREYAALFGGQPLVVGLSADLPDPGSYRACQVAALPLLLVRGEDGEVRAFLNSCRHRGSRVADGSGTAGRVFKCPYHAWCYDIHGRLIAQPLSHDGFADAHSDAIELVSFPVSEAGGLITIRPDPSTAPLHGAEHLGGLGDELDGLGFDRLTLMAEQHHDLRANWKQPYETFLEAYHVFALHRTTLANQIMSTPMLADFYGPHGRGVLMGREMPKRLPGLPRDQWRLRQYGNLVYWLFPNAIISLPMTGHAELWLVYPHRTDPGRCHVNLKFYVPTHTVEERAEFWQRMLNYSSTIVLEEDFRQQEAIYNGIASGMHPGFIFGRNEPALIHYHRALHAALDRPAPQRPVRMAPHAHAPG